MNSNPELAHATAIAAGDRAAIITGPSGSGKSDLALRCLLHPPSALTPDAAFLISDDQVLVERRGAVLFARGPETIRNKLEVRGLGVIEVRAMGCPEAPIALLVELTTADKIERLPDPQPSAEILGIFVPVLRLAPFEPSAPAKVLLALACGVRPRPLD